MTRMSEAIIDAVLSGLCECWGILLAVEAVMATVSETFDGDGVVHPEAMLELDQVRQRILRCADALANEGTVMELPDEPDADFAEMLQRRLAG
jgi:hypothetical protein